MISVTFKHTRSNFFIYCKSHHKDLHYFRTLTAGNAIDFSLKSSKKQKTRHLAQQLGEIAANKINFYFRARYDGKDLASLNRASYQLYDIRRRIGLVDGILNALTKNRKRYLRIQPSLKKARSVGSMRPLSTLPYIMSLYSIACHPTERRSDEIARFYRLIKRRPSVELEDVKAYSTLNDELSEQIYIDFKQNVLEDQW